MPYTFSKWRLRLPRLRCPFCRRWIEVRADAIFRAKRAEAPVKAPAGGGPNA